jgi:uncharacterized protein YfaS (alpha-2-macroglobulin family)
MVLTLGGAAGALIYAERLPNTLSEQETLILGASRLIPGSPAALLIRVQEHGNGQPIPGAEVEVQMQPSDGGRGEVLFVGTTDTRGELRPTFTVPDVAKPAQTLVVRTQSAQGRDELEQPVTVERSYKVLLTSDKPLYQPGQVIHVRALAVSAFDRVPTADQPVELTIADAKGNKVYRETTTTSAYGVAAWDFQLASEVNAGAYKITATLADTTSERTVTVKPYVLPKFKVTASPDETFYRPGDRVTGSVAASYFFGKPVAGGEVVLTGWTYDVERVQALELQGTTDDTGRYSFEFDLPDHFVGAVEGTVSDFLLETAVTDGAGHTEQVSLRIPVAQQGIIIEAVPEAGSLKPGLENVLYLLTAYPDGAPAQCDVTVLLNGVEYSAGTGPYGLGELRVTPDDAWAELILTAQDALGHVGEAVLYLEGTSWGEQILLRPQRATYRVGDTLEVEVLSTSPAGSAYLDVTREGQILLTQALDLPDGRATAQIDLTPDLYGTLALHAYKILSSGEIVRDTRLVVVEAADDLNLAIHLDRDTYLPGETAALTVDVTGQDDAGAPAALGLAVVDESVFALQEQDPGFAKLYFLLEKELLEPKFDLHGVSLPELIQRPDLVAAQDAAAKASLAGVGASHFGLHANSRVLKEQQAYRLQEQVATGVAQVLYGFLLAVPLAIGVLLGTSLWRERALGRSLAFGMGLPLLFLAWIAVMLILIPVPDRPWIDSPLDKLEHWIDVLGPALLCVIAPVSLGGLIGGVGLAVRAVRKAETSLGLALLLALSYVLLLAGLVVALLVAEPPEPSALTLILFGIGYLLLPLAFGARAVGFALRREGWAAAATACLAGLLLVGGALPAALAGGPAIGGEVADWNVEPGMVLEEAEVEGLVRRNGMPTPAPQAAPPGDKGAAAPGQEPPLLRQFFPETMYWNPEAITDGAGRWQTDLELAHTITTWRLTALASAQDGRLGSATAPIRVFQDFFVDIDLPVALTQGDEVAMPVAVYNYLDTPQRVELTLDEKDALHGAVWFERLDEPTQVLQIGAGDVDVVYFRIRVTATEGRFRPIVTAIGETMSDATTLRHDVQIVPNGKRIDDTWSDRLSEDVERTVTIPAQAIPGTAQILVKLYPGILSQVVEGLDALLRMPFGCFEQTSSTTYPNVLVLDYLKSTGQTSPEVQMKAEEYINLGYQRLTTFEVRGGGFSLFGEAPPDRMLTAYGLMEFRDMSRVHPVDQAMLDRAARWLLSEQRSDGSWDNDQGLVHEQSWSKLGNERLPVTAYVVWALTEAGYADERGTQQGLDYVREFHADAEDPYVLALVANALAAADPGGGTTEKVLDRLAEMATLEGNGATWISDIATFMGGTGDVGSIETTALAAYAFLRAEQHTDLANQALTYLIQQKDSYGTWHSTQATVLTLKALLLSVRKGGEGADATVNVSLNGEQTDPVHIRPENWDVVQLVSFTDKPVVGDNRLRIDVEGEGNLMVQISTRYYLPWDEVARLAPAKEWMDIRVDYDRTELAVNDVIQVSVHVELLEGAARQAIVDLGIPPGFEVLSEDLADLVAQHSDLPPEYEGVKFSRFDLTGRQIIVYLEGLKAGQPLDFRYRIRARYPIRAQTPPTQAYDYYNPGVSAVSAPAAIEVTP